MGAVRQLGSPMRLSRTPVVQGDAGPLLGEDTRAALERVRGSRRDEIDALAEAAWSPPTSRRPAGAGSPVPDPD